MYRINIWLFIIIIWITCFIIAVLIDWIGTDWYRDINWGRAVLIAFLATIFGAIFFVLSVYHIEVNL